MPKSPSSHRQASSPLPEVSPISAPGVAKTVLIGFLVYLFCQIFFLIYVQFPGSFSFDEAHYVPSAKQFLELVENRNWEHPPLGKLLMAVGIGLFGDRPFGWRFMSTLFGALTAAGMFAWGKAVFRRLDAALFVALVSLANGILYVQARIGMLDTFMEAFLVWGLAAFCLSWTTGLSRRKTFQLHAFSGAMFGFATASKWAAVVPWFLCFGLIVSVKLAHAFGIGTDSVTPAQKTSRKKGQKPGAPLSTARPSSLPPHEERWFSSSLFRELSPFDLAAAWLLIPIFCYFLTFIPFLFVQHEPAYTVLDFFKMQYQMYDGQLRVVSSHPYMSDWKGWPLLARPIWYSFEQVQANPLRVRGVLCLGNPLVFWGGLVAIAVCLSGWIHQKSREAFLILTIFCALYFCWGIIPRKISFFYYYYPAAMTLSLAWVYFFDTLDSASASIAKYRVRWIFLGAAFGIFYYFFPILAALKISMEEWRSLMWFSKWI